MTQQQSGPRLTDDGIDVTNDPQVTIDDLTDRYETYNETADQVVLRLPRSGGYPNEIIEFAKALDMERPELEGKMNETATKSPKHGWYLTVAK